MNCSLNSEATLLAAESLKVAVFDFWDNVLAL